jgi:hypothetical protein
MAQRPESQDTENVMGRSASKFLLSMLDLNFNTQ